MNRLASIRLVPHFAACLPFLAPVLVLVFAAPPARAGIEDCVWTLNSGVDPRDLEKEAKFVANHKECLADLVYPEPLIPYAALSGSLDTANQSGALAKVGMAFGDYETCVAKFDLGKATIKQLEPALRPVCDQIHLDCGVFASEGAGQVNSALAENVPLLGLLPCACAAATSGLGIDRLRNQLATAEACGSTISQAADSVAKVGQDALCAVESIWGGCSSDSPPPLPPTGIDAGEAWCAPYGGIKNLSSRTNRPDDFDVVCNDGSTARVHPGRKPETATAAQIAQYKALLDKRNQIMRTANVAWCAAQHSKIRQQYDPKCHDETCRRAIESIWNDYRQEILKRADDPFFPSVRHAETEAFLLAPEYQKRFQQAVNDSIIRDPHAAYGSVLQAYGCKSFLGRKREELCPGEAAYGACKKYVDHNLLRACYQEGFAKSRYANAVMDDPGADPTVRMRLYDCEGFLGRANENLCNDQKGFLICQEAARQGLLDECILAGSTPQHFKAAKKVSGPPAGPPEKWLPENGCESFLGRKGEWLCEDPGGSKRCLQYLPSSAVAVCITPPNQRRISPRHLDEKLAAAGCAKSTSRTANTEILYICPDSTAQRACEGFQAEIGSDIGTLHCQLVPPAEGHG
jgi:hypothetical protein